MSRIQFQAGEPAPWFQCAATGNSNYSFDTVAGRYIVLSFLGASRLPKSAAVVDFLTTTLRDRFDDNRFAWFGVTVDPEDMSHLKMDLPGIRYFFDLDRAVSLRYGAIPEGVENSANQVGYSPFTLVLDPNLRVLADISLLEVESHNQAVLKVLSELPQVNDYAQVDLHAPVLVVPRVFEPELCRELIGLYEADGGEESGFMRDQGGKTVGVLDSNFKRRKDYLLDMVPGQNEALIKRIQNRIVNRLTPEIQKAFQYKVTRLERYLVACYEGESRGFFRRHRDNTAKGTAHRRFAVTINLNTGEYDGGQLVFPEFGTKTYQAPLGGAVVFSCSLLHEATPVTAGTRYAFLPFLYDDEAARLRQQNQRYLSGEVIQL